MSFTALFVAFVAPATAETLTYRFLWQGGGGYTMQGAFAYDSAFLGKKRIIGTDLTCFEVAGFQDDRPLGRWALQMLLPDTTWVFTFDPNREALVVFDELNLMPQAWNMDGFGENCGSPGFGFNIGNAAQDICVNGQLIVESQVPPPQPFPAFRDAEITFSADACRPTELLSWLD